MLARMLRTFLRRDVKREWSAMLDSLRIDCAAAYPEDQERCVRELVDLLATVPKPILLMNLISPSAMQLGEWLAAGNYDGAVISMLGADARHRFSRDGEGNYLASVTLSHQAHEHLAIGDTLALALIGAIALSLLDLNSKLRRDRHQDPQMV